MEEKLDITLLKELGKLTRKIRKEVSKIVKVGISNREIINFVENKIFEKGHLPAFPCTVCVNNIAAHYTIFESEYILKKGDLVKIDFGLSHNGTITDNAFTIEIETNKYEKLMKANLEGLNKAIETIEIDNQISNVGKAVFEIAKKAGFNTIHNLSGHQIAKNNLHCGISVPNYDNLNQSKPQDNQEFAIEPFFTLGEPKIKTGENSNILHLVNYKPIRDPIAKKILEYIKENFSKLPFSKRWLLKEIKNEIPNFPFKTGFDKRKILYALRILKMQKVITEYQILETVDNASVSQFEDTIIFSNNKKIIITRL